MEHTYTMDDWTFSHLTAWCERFYREEEVDSKREAIHDMLEEMPVEDAEYSLSFGWEHVASLL